MLCETGCLESFEITCLMNHLRAHLHDGVVWDLRNIVEKCQAMGEGLIGQRVADKTPGGI